MSSQGKLSALLAQACGQADDVARERAFEELLRLVLIFVRSSMGSGLRRNRESVDICQTIAKSFVGDLREGKVTFASEGALVSYLQTVVRTKLAEAARHDRALKRGGEFAAIRLGQHDDEVIDPASDDPTASTQAMGDEQFERVLSRLSEEEMDLVRLRRAGLSWDQIGARTGRGTAAVRQAWSRLHKRLLESMESPEA
jgi:RNA polymerase sigma factor (sigma-70 family)